jgi:hypothetical protein
MTSGSIEKRQGLTHPVWVQRVEGLAMLVAAVIGFADTGSSWWWFAGLILVPDISMVGYLSGPSLGAITYNLGHNLVGPGLLFGWFWLGGPDLVLGLAWIWLGHIGLDRMLGYGLKHPDAFTHTHLGWIGSDKGRQPGRP